MTLNLKDTKRVAFDVPVELHTRFDNIVRYGNKERLLVRVFELLTGRLEEGGYMMIGAIMAGEFDPLFIKKEEK